MKRLAVKAAAILLAGLLTIGTLSYTAFAADGVEKDETVYVNLKGDGSVDAVYVVNAFEAKNGTAFTDYGDYAEVKNMTTIEPLICENGACQIELPAGRFYYQGDMKELALPWDIGITYRLNGRPVTAEQLAGAIGKLEICISVDRGDARYVSFYDNYVLQISYALDAEKCLNVNGDGANIVTAGSAINVSYTVMQGADAKTYTLTTDVTDFEMSAIQFRAVHNDSQVDTGEFEQKLEDVKADIDELADAVDKLADAGKSLAGGSDKFYNGLKSFEQNASEIAAASAQIESALYALNGKASALAAGSPDLSALAQSLTASPDPQVKTLAAAYMAQSQAVTAFAQGISELYTQYQAFNAGMQTLPSKTAEMADGYGKLNSGTDKLADSLNTLNENVSEMPEQVDDMTAKVDDMLNKYGGDSFVPVSFASPKNTVNSVLFVMKTTKISLPEPETVEEKEPEPQTFFEKLLDLFGLYKG